MAFKHTIIPLHPSLIISDCLGCGAFIAASIKEPLIVVAEEYHQCSRNVFKPAIPAEPGRRWHDKPIEKSLSGHSPLSDASSLRLQINSFLALSWVGGIS
jgi:hypothetical protein